MHGMLRRTSLEFVQAICTRILMSLATENIVVKEQACTLTITNFETSIC